MSGKEGGGERERYDLVFVHREETEIIEGEVVEIQIDRPTTTSVS